MPGNIMRGARELEREANLAGRRRALEEMTAGGAVAVNHLSPLLFLSGSSF